MATNDPNKARARFLNALRRITNGLEVQRARILERAAEAPRTVLGRHEMVDLRGEQGNDLDYYAYELGRLQDLTKTVNRTFDDPEEIVNALTAFEKAVPNLRKARNPLTHPSDDARLDDVAWFSSLMNLGPNGTVESLVDPRYQHHDAAMNLAEALSAYLGSNGG